MVELNPERNKYIFFCKWHTDTHIFELSVRLFDYFIRTYVIHIPNYQSQLCCNWIYIWYWYFHYHIIVSLLILILNHLTMENWKIIVAIFPSRSRIFPSELLKLPWQSPLLAKTRKYSSSRAGPIRVRIYLSRTLPWQL